MDGKRVILAAHRGDRVSCPENTLAAFRAALELGCDMIETDIRRTKDGELVLIHDRSTLRTSGIDLNVDELTLEQLRGINVGATHPSGKVCPVPTVRELLELIKNSDMLVNWELKDYPCEVGEAFAFESADRLIDTIRKHGLEERSMINSFSDRVLEHVCGKYGSAFPIHGQGIYHCQRTNDSATVKQEELYNWCCLYPNEKGFTPLDFPENFEYCKKHGIFPCVCVPDHIDTYKKYVELGCRMFTSNDIYEADRILKELGLRL